MFRTIPKRLFSTIRPLQLSYQTSFKPMLAEKGFAGAVGNTPLIKLNKLSKATGRNIFGKAEWMNPGGSVKDRAALWLVERAEERGWIKPGGTIVEVLPVTLVLVWLISVVPRVTNVLFS